MLSKLTFSLVLVLMCAFVATSAFGQAIPAATLADAEEPAGGKFAVVTKGAVGADADTAGANHGITGGLANANTKVDLAGATDLYDILQSGGTIYLTLSVIEKGGEDSTIVSDADGAGFDAATFNAASRARISAAAAAAFKHRLIITEIMWGRDRSSATAFDIDTQWIEIFNPGADLESADVVILHFSRGRSAMQVGDVMQTGGQATATDFSDDTYGVIVDMVSRVDGLGGTWDLLGSDGVTTAITTGVLNPILPTPLVSMYRKINLDVDKYKAHDTNVLDGLGSGVVGGSWAASAGSTNMIGQFTGSPGSVHVATGGLVKTFAKSPGAVPPTMNLGTDDAPKNLDPGSGVIINEVRNDSTGANLDWIELFNNTDPNAPGVTSANVENWELSIVTVDKDADGNYHTMGDDNFHDDSLAVLPRYKLSPGEYLVIYNRDPGDTGLAGGQNIEAIAAGTQVNKGASHVYTISANLDLPSDKKFLIILRNGNDKKGTHEKVVDFIGNGYFTREETNKFNTQVWPFIGWAAPGDTAAFGDNTFASASMSWGRKTELGHEVGTADPKEAAKRASTHLNRGVYWPKGREGNRSHKDDWAQFGFVGTGYDRAVDTLSSPGTPGYANVAINVVKDDRDGAAKKEAYAFGGTVTISEVMVDAGPRWNLVQWIELYNSSMSETINLDGWKLEIRNKEDVESYVDSSFNFMPHTKVLPNQTLLLVSGTGTNDVDSNRVYNLYQHHRRELGLLARDSVLLSRTGFYLKLTAKVAGGGRTTVSMVMDEAGNVEVKGAQRNVMWELPARDPAARQSLVRVYGTGVGARAIDGTRDMAADGTMESSWKQSNITGAGLSYYGHRNDISTPGFRLGGPLPVSLSSFRPVRNQTTGHVDITWVTQSELNNAGFNILRSEGKGSEFKVINVKGIVPGHGTTSEKHVYTFTDTTAKPNVVYYYQIEDVSLDGKRTTLRSTHLRGHVSAGGKLTTTWGDLKLQK